MHKARKSLGGQIFKNRPIELTYIFELDDDLEIDKVIAGRVVDKQEPFDINKEFMLIEWDQEETYNYDITMPIRKLDANEMQEFSLALSRYNNKKSRRK